LRIVAAAAAVTAAVAVAAAGAQTPTWGDGPSFAYGSRSYEVERPPSPHRVTIASSGLVTVDGRVTKTISQRRLRGVAAAVRRERFFSLPREIQCPQLGMIVVSSYVSATVGGRTRTVRVDGATCNRRYGRTVKAIAEAAGD
jgi:hypothetical protein